MNRLRMVLMVVLVLVMLVGGQLFAIEGSFEPISDEILDSKPMRALYNPISKGWVKSVGILGRPASEIWAYLAFESAGATASIFSGTLGAKVTKDALCKVAEKYVGSSPEDVCKELASSMMDVGLEAYRRNYPRYKVWKKSGLMSKADRVAFMKDNYTSNYLGFGKDLWADVMSYEYKQGKYSSGATRKYLLEEIASLNASASSAIDVFDKLKSVVGLVRSESLKSYPPYNDHLERVEAFEDHMDVEFSLAKREEVGGLNRKCCGEVTLRDCDKVPEMFSFKEGGVLNLGEVDVKGLSENESMKKMLLIDLFFDMPHGLGLNNKELDEQLVGLAGIVDMGKVSIDELSKAPKDGYKLCLTSDEIKVGHSYCVKTANGKNYGKIEILEFERGRGHLDDGFVRFKWQYQPMENVRKFDSVAPKKDPTKFSQYLQVQNASREEMKRISATLVKLPQAQFDAFDVEFLRLIWLKAEDNNVLIKVVRTKKLSNRELIDSAEDAAFYDWNLRVLKEEGIMSWEQVRGITNRNTRKGMKRP